MFPTRASGTVRKEHGFDAVYFSPDCIVDDASYICATLWSFKNNNGGKRRKGVCNCDVCNPDTFE